MLSFLRTRKSNQTRYSLGEWKYKQTKTNSLVQEYFYFFNFFEEGSSNSESFSSETRLVDNDESKTVVSLESPSLLLTEDEEEERSSFWDAQFHSEESRVPLSDVIHSISSICDASGDSDLTEGSLLWSWVLVSGVFFRAFFTWSVERLPGELLERLIPRFVECSSWFFWKSLSAISERELFFGNIWEKNKLE